MANLESVVYVYILSDGPNCHKVGVSNTPHGRIAYARKQRGADVRPVTAYKLPHDVGRAVEWGVHQTLENRVTAREWYAVDEASARAVIEEAIAYFEREVIEEPEMLLPRAQRKQGPK